MSAELVRVFNAVDIRQRAVDGYLDATAMCRATGKKWADHWRLNTTGEFIQALAESTGIPVDSLVESRSSRGGGTWVHPQVAMHLAQWCSPQFAVLVSGWVLDILTTGKAEVAETDVDPVLAMIDVVRVNRLKQIELEKKVTVVERTVFAASGKADRAMETAQAAFRTLKHQTGWYSVRGYCNLIGRQCSEREAIQCGIDLTARMKAEGETPQRVADERYGQVNIYPETLLADYFGGLRCNV